MPFQLAKYTTPTLCQQWIEICRQEIRLTEINDELGNLEASDPFLPPDLYSTGALKVVPVHDYMYGEVESDGYPRDRRRSDELGVAE
jgi:hypothetical protein